MPKPPITFIVVHDNASKLNKICSLVQHHFNLKESLLIAVSSLEAATYVDHLLWRVPEESFIPHQISQSPCQEMVAITMANANINQAKILLNLRAEPISFAPEFIQLYDLLDLTHPEKERLSRHRQSVYESNGFSIHSDPYNISNFGDSGKSFI